MSLKFLRTIKTHLLLLILIAILPALGIIIYSGIELSQRDIEDARSDAMEVVKSLAYEHERAVEGARQFLMTLAKVPEIRSLNVQASNGLLAELLKQNPLYGVIFVLDSKGVLVSSSLPFKSVNMRERKYFKDILKTKDFSVGEYAVCPAVKRPVLHLAYPITNAKGKFKGMVVVSLDVARYAEIFATKKMPPDSILSISDHKGVLLYTYPEKGHNNIPRTDLPDLIAYMSDQKEEGIFTYAGIDDVKRLQAYRTFRLKKNESPYLFIRVGIPEEKALLHARKSLSINVILLGVAFIVAVISAWILGNVTIVDRVNRLVDVSRRLAYGDLKIRTGLGYKNDELGQMERAFDEMAETLETKNVEQKVTEEKLKNIADEWQATFDSITDLVMILNNEFKIVRVNGATVRFFNIPMNEIIGEHCFTLMHGTAAPYEECPFTKMTKTKRYEEIELFMPERDKWFLISVDPIIDRYENIVGVVHIVKDISDRKRSEEAIHAERQRFQILADNVPFGMVLIDNDGMFTYINPRFTEIFGYDLTNVPNGRTWFRKAFPDFDYRHMAISDWLNDSKETSLGKKTPRTYSIVCKDGNKREVSFVLVRLSSGETLITCEDVTEHKRLEAQLIQSQRMEAIGTLAGGIAHDFNNLLMTILGYSSLMLMDMKPHHPDYEKLKVIEEQVQSGANLTKQLLGFARGGKYEIKTTDLNELLARSSDIFGRTKKEISIFRKYEKELWTVEVDRGQIEHVFLNLFVNAWHAMPGGGELYLETRNIVVDGTSSSVFASLKPGRYVRVSVTDTGVGIDAATQKRIFEPFFTTKEMGRGTGLGLASAYGIIKNHGGTINLYSEKGKGTTFSIYLPASEKTLDEEKAVHGEVLKGTETILLVDDQDIVIDVGSNMLQAMGYTVLPAKSGKEAVRIYGENAAKIKLVILDMIMPVMSGGETYDLLKNMNPHLKVILSSGYSVEGQAAKILERGCNGFIQKPFNVFELSKKIREVLDY